MNDAGQIELGNNLVSNNKGPDVSDNALTKVQTKLNELVDIPKTPTIEQILCADRYAVVQHLVGLLDAHANIPPDLTEAAISRMFLDSILDLEHFVGDEHAMKAKIEAAESAAYSGIRIHEAPKLSRVARYEKEGDNIGNWDEDKESISAISAGTSATFPKGLWDNGSERNFDALGKVVFTIIKRAPLQVQERLIRTIGEKLKTVPIDPDRSEEVFEELFGWISADGLLDYDATKKLYAQFFSTILEDPDVYEYGQIEGNLLNDMFDFAMRWKRPIGRELLRYAGNIGDENIQRRCAGIVADQYGYAFALNTVRTLVENALPEDKTKLERFGKILLNFPPDDPRPFHTQLSQVYAVCKFDDYDANQHAQIFDERLLEDVIRSLGKDAPIVVDLGSGTGRLSNAIAARTSAQVIGLELSQDNIRVAQQEAEKATLGEQVEYILSDWNQQGTLGERKADLLYCLGRSLPHAQTRDELIRILENVSTMLAVGGTFVFDVPDPNRGNIFLRRQEVAELMRKLQVPVDQVPLPEDPSRTMPDIDVIIDSPDGENFYNRRVPQLADLEDLLFRQGFTFEVIAREPIRGAGYSADDRNVYIRAKKLPSTPWERQKNSSPAMPNSTALASLQQSPGGE